MGKSIEKTNVKETVNAQNRALPLGMGYKSCWMVVEGASQKAVMDAFLQGRKMKYSYEKGLEKVEKAGAKENKLLVTASCNHQNYVIGTPVSQFFYETEEFLARCRNFPRVYVYMTHRVSETHGFALVENGKLIRFFKYDENEIKNIGEPLPEEIALGYRLPESFEDVWDEEENFTEVDEDMLIELAIRQVGIDAEQYPYKDVRVGKRFEYAAELAKDPYPDGKDEIPEEIWNLPVVQRFSAAKTYREKLEIFEEIKDELTHPMIDAFGKTIEMCAEYGRLSQRTGELYRILWNLADTEERTMTQEDFLKELSRGHFLFEDKIFEQVILEGLSCEKLVFRKCSFFHSRFLENEIERLEMEDGMFVNSVFSGNIKNKSLILRNDYFETCKIHNLVLTENSGLLEMRDCRFSECEFFNVKIQADLRWSGGWTLDCTGDAVYMENVREIGEEEKQMFKKSGFKNCYINGELQG